MTNVRLAAATMLATIIAILTPAYAQTFPMPEQKEIVPFEHRYVVCTTRADIRELATSSRTESKEEFEALFNSLFMADKCRDSVITAFHREQVESNQITVKGIEFTEYLMRVTVYAIDRRPIQPTEGFLILVKPREPPESMFSNKL